MTHLWTTRLLVFCMDPHLYVCKYEALWLGVWVNRLLRLVVKSCLYPGNSVDHCIMGFCCYSDSKTEVVVDLHDNMLHVDMHRVTHAQLCLSCTCQTQGLI